MSREAGADWEAWEAQQSGDQSQATGHQSRQRVWAGGDVAATKIEHRGKSGSGRGSGGE